MKKFIYLTLLGFLLFLANQTNAQNLIAVQNGGTLAFYTVLDSAITHTTDGDTLYLPGGSFPMTKTIPKRLHIIGVRYNPDSTIITLPTYITGSIYLNASASGGSMTGIRVPGTIYFGNTSAAENYTIFRYKIFNIAFFQSYSWGFASKNNVFIENIIDYLSLSGGESNVFYNNILGGLAGGGSYNIIKNNIFLAPNSPLATYFSAITSSTFENNIFVATSTIQSYGDTYFANNVFKNNLFVENIGFPYLTTNIGSSNIVNQARESIFVNQTGDSFDYAQDYHLKPDSPGKNAGKDGTDIGIYGGAFPWKEGSIPANPHFQSVKIAPKTDNNGNLNVKIKVAAQDN